MINNQNSNQANATCTNCGATLDPNDALIKGNNGIYCSMACMSANEMGDPSALNKWPIDSETDDSSGTANVG